MVWWREYLSLTSYWLSIFCYFILFYFIFVFVAWLSFICYLGVVLVQRFHGEKICHLPRLSFCYLFICICCLIVVYLLFGCRFSASNQVTELANLVTVAFQKLENKLFIKKKLFIIIILLKSSLFHLNINQNPSFNPIFSTPTPFNLIKS